MLGLADKSAQRGCSHSRGRGQSAAVCHRRAICTGVEPLALLRAQMDLAHRITVAQVSGWRRASASNIDEDALGCLRANCRCGNCCSRDARKCRCWSARWRCCGRVAGQMPDPGRLEETRNAWPVRSGLRRRVKLARHLGCIPRSLDWGELVEASSLGAHCGCRSCDFSVVCCVTAERQFSAAIRECCAILHRHAGLRRGSL